MPGHFHPTAVHHALMHGHDHAPCLLGRGEYFSYAQARDWVARCQQQLLSDLQGQAVAIWMDKGPHYALSILAVLFADARYVPLDGSQPLERAQRIVHDAEPRVLILDEAHAAQWQTPIELQGRLQLIVLSEDPLPDAAASPDLRRWHRDLRDGPAPQPLQTRACQRQDTAALLYTSGSTGTPKGVRMGHGNLLNFAQWASQTLGLGHSDRLLNLASFNFDLSTFDLFAALQVGASVYISHESESRHAASVAELLHSQAISVMYTVPSMYALLVRSGALQALRRCHLRHVVFAGEVMPKPVLQALADSLPKDCALYNFYGPTETNVCLWHRVSNAELLNPEAVPIGQPIAGAQVWLQNERGQRIESGDEIGEIWVGGDCVTPGYWRRPNDPNSPNHLLQQHATGDYGSRGPQGLMYHGRKDRMIKLQGYRVELGEIEAALLRHPALSEVGVLALPSPSAQGGIRLLAVFACHEHTPVPDTLALKAFCAQYVPGYMVPHRFEHLPRLPRNANGKLDWADLRQQLAQPLDTAGAPA